MSECTTCRGLGYIIVMSGHAFARVTCSKCDGRGFLRHAFPSGNYAAIVRDEIRRKRGI